jgi:hypothetical protein
MQAVVFNALLILMPILAAETIAGAFSYRSIGDEPTVESLNTTRRNMDDAFAARARSQSDRMNYWSQLINDQLGEKNVASARGFLLASPVMLDRDDAKTVQAAADSATSGSEDERLANAAMFILYDDVRQKFEQTLNPLVTSETFEEEALDETAEMIITPQLVSTGRGSAETVSARLGRLGDFSDLADNSKRWLAGDRMDPVILKMTGLALLQAEQGDGSAEAVIQAATILKASRKARRLSEDYNAYLTRRLDLALPDAALTPLLEESLTGLAPTAERAALVKAAYRDALDLEGMERLQGDLNQISRVADLTSVEATVDLLELVESPTDMRRVKLLAEAGGDRAVALTSLEGRRALKRADAGVEWTQQMTLRVMVLVAAAMALFWLVLTTFFRAFPRRAPPPEVFMGKEF